MHKQEINILLNEQFTSTWTPVYSGVSVGNEYPTGRV